MLPRHVPAMLSQHGFRPAHPAARGAPSEAEYTGRKVRVLSAAKARVYRPGHGEVAISIRGPGDPEVRLSSRFIALLPLVFDDTGIFATRSADSTSTDTIMTAEQADAAVAFVREHRDANTLVIHCTAGVSRSRSLAAAICRALELPYEFTVRNQDVYRATLGAFARVNERQSTDSTSDQL